jgi:hypothetical protein
MGLPREVQNLVILVFADQTNRSFFLHGGPVPGSLQSLPDEVELREQRLPDRADWDAAVNRASALLGVTASPLLSAANVVKLVEDVKGQVVAIRLGCERLCHALRDAMPWFGISAESAPRMRTATAGLAFVEGVASSRPEDVVRVVARARVETSEAAMGSSLKRATELCKRLETTRWELLEAVAKLTDARAAAATAIRERVADALSKDEYAVALGPELDRAESEAVRLLTQTPPPPPPPGRRVVEKRERRALSAAEGAPVFRHLEEVLGREAALRLDLEWEIYKPEEPS